VDFLLERDGVFYPIEAKAGSMPRRSDTRGIAAFRETYPGLKVSKGLVLAPTESTYPLSENDVVVPWDIDGAR
jgi:hypothetical protein